MGLLSSLLKVIHLFASMLINYPARIAESSSPTSTIKTTVCQYRTGTIGRLQFYFSFLLKNLTISISIHVWARTPGKKLLQFTFYKDLLGEVITQVSSWHKIYSNALVFLIPCFATHLQMTPCHRLWTSSSLFTEDKRKAARLPAPWALVWVLFVFYFGTTHLASVSWYTLKKNY